MRRITPEVDGPAVHAAWLALNDKVCRDYRALRTNPAYRDNPVVAWILGEGPRPAHVPARRDDDGQQQTEAA